MRKLLAFAVILLFIGMVVVQNISISEPTSLQTEYSIERGTLSGYVMDTYMEPIEGAKVRVYFHESYGENYTDHSGYYHVTNIPICNCTKNATVSKKGYRSESVLLSIDEITNHNFVLTFLGETLYVGGSGQGNYSRIQDAVDNASNWDTVFVYSGIYYENVIVDKSICLIGEKKNITIIDGSMNKEKDVICFTASHIGIEKFTIKNGKNGIFIDGDYGVVDNLNIVENIIIDNIQYGVFFFCSGYNNVLNNIITNNIYGIKAYEFCSNIIFGNIISSSSEAGIHLTSAVNAGNCT